nr:immunoglobulin heavy chain junction region [Macaca mulatta]
CARRPAGIYALDSW